MLGEPELEGLTRCPASTDSQEPGAGGEHPAQPKGKGTLSQDFPWAARASTGLQAASWGHSSSTAAVAPALATGPSVVRGQEACDGTLPRPSPSTEPGAARPLIPHLKSL